MSKIKEELEREEAAERAAFLARRAERQREREEDEKADVEWADAELAAWEQAERERERYSTVGRPVAVSDHDEPDGKEVGSRSEPEEAKELQGEPDAGRRVSFKPEVLAGQGEPELKAPEPQRRMHAPIGYSPAVLRPWLSVKERGVVESRGGADAIAVHFVPGAVGGLQMLVAAGYEVVLACVCDPPVASLALKAMRQAGIVGDTAAGCSVSEHNCLFLRSSAQKDVICSKLDFVSARLDDEWEALFPPLPPPRGASPQDAEDGEQQWLAEGLQAGRGKPDSSYHAVLFNPDPEADAKHSQYVRQAEARRAKAESAVLQVVQHQVAMASASQRKEEQGQADAEALAESFAQARIDMVEQVKGLESGGGARRVTKIVGEGGGGGVGAWLRAAESLGSSDAADARAKLGGGGGQGGELALRIHTGFVPGLGEGDAVGGSIQGTGGRGKEKNWWDFRFDGDELQRLMGMVDLQRGGGGEGRGEWAGGGQGERIGKGGAELRAWIESGEMRPFDSTSRNLFHQTIKDTRALHPLRCCGYC
jgi:hypothetical protein